jgi:glyoxylase-like metal-dependent hydrolase (beta-lactamase superfamily II)
MRIGQLQVDAVYDGVGYADPSRYAGTTEQMWAQHQQFLNPDGKVEMALGGFLIRGASDRVTLVDLGYGTHQSAVFVGGKLLDSLAQLSVKPEDITDVILTHLHFDHVGWASDAGQSVFPNATYRCSSRDLEHFYGRDDRITNILTPVQNQLQTWDDSGPLVPGADAMVAAGHTPGSTIIVLSSGTARGLLLGDVVHCPVELIDDEWSGMADVDPELAKRTRNALAREIEGTDTPIAAAHFPGLAFGRLLAANGKRNWLTFD